MYVCDLYCVGMRMCLPCMDGQTLYFFAFCNYCQMQGFLLRTPLAIVTENEVLLVERTYYLLLASGVLSRKAQVWL